MNNNVVKEDDLEVVVSKENGIICFDDDNPSVSNFHFVD